MLRMTIFCRGTRRTRLYKVICSDCGDDNNKAVSFGFTGPGEFFFWNHFRLSFSERCVLPMRSSDKGWSNQRTLRMRLDNTTTKQTGELRRTRQFLSSAVASGMVWDLLIEFVVVVVDE